MNKHTLTIDHIDPQNGILVSGLCNDFNEVLQTLSYNAIKSNRFVPYRTNNYPAPKNKGDIGEFLIGADIESDIPGEWVVCEFYTEGSEWWAESNRIGNGHTLGNQVMRDKMPEEEFKRQRKKATTTLLDRNPDHFSVMARIARESETPEVRSARAKNIPEEARQRGRDKTNKQKWMSTDPNWPPHVSTAGPLSRWQNARGIDRSHRVKLPL